MKDTFHSQKSIQIHSEEDVLYAMELTKDLANQSGIPSNEQILLTLVTEEALVNALEFCEKVEEKFVSIRWKTSRDEFEMAITQTGMIFNIEKKDDVNYGLRGRGLQLIIHIMDDVWLEEDEENKVTLYMKKMLSNIV